MAQHRRIKVRNLRRSPDEDVELACEKSRVHRSVQRDVKLPPVICGGILTPSLEPSPKE
jgi:hypothetical protein